MSYKQQIIKNTIYVPTEFNEQLKLNYEAYRKHLHKSQLLARPLSYSGWLLSLISKATDLITAEAVEVSANV